MIEVSRRSFLTGSTLALLGLGSSCTPPPYDFEVWGDSHLSRIFDLGAGPDLQRISDSDPRVTMTTNHARPGATVSDWIGEFSTAPGPRIVVVSAGTNEFLRILNGEMTCAEVVASFHSLGAAVSTKVQRLIWVPAQTSHGWLSHPNPEARAALSEGMAALRSHVEVSEIEWNPTASMMAPDGLHFTASASATLAQMVVDRVIIVGALG